MIKRLRPGYKPPNRKQVADELLDAVYNEKWYEVKQSLTGKSVCMALDGWSNVHNDPILCVSVSDILDGCTHLTETIDTEDKGHTSDYLLEVAERSIKNCQKYGCKVRSFVTDNAANMAKMREELAKGDIEDVITYGCSAHLLNLLAHDLEIAGIKEHIKQIVKYFKNTHFAAAKYKQAGGTALVLPTDVRWNSLADCIESYLNNWHIIAKVCSENRSAINSNIGVKVNDVNLKQNAQDYMKTLKAVSVSLDKVQRDDCTIGEAVEVWLDLQDFLKCNRPNPGELAHFTKWYTTAMTNAHFLANIMDPRFQGERINEEEYDAAMEYAAVYHPDTMPDFIKLKAKCSPFKAYLFNPETLVNIKPIVWWMALEKSIHPATLSLAQQLHSAVASSAGIERLFSTFGFVHSKVRNRLGTEKSAKLVSVFRALNQKVQVEDE